MHLISKPNHYVWAILYKAKLKHYTSNILTRPDRPLAVILLERVWELTQGQPWLVNALGYETCFKMETKHDHGQPITYEMVDEAKENLILRRETHLDQLIEKLQEGRVQRVIEPVLASGALAEDLRPDDVSYVVDLGLLTQTRNGVLSIANPIYQEVVPRELAWVIQSGMSEQPQWYIRSDGQLDMNKLLQAFQNFFQEHSEHWLERYQYKEAGPQLLLQAFLQRIVISVLPGQNAISDDGRIEREYGLGRLRTDLLIIWPHPGGVQKVVIELKVLHKSLEKTIERGLQQTWKYLDRCTAEEAHLVIFDRSEKKTWEEKLFQREATVQDQAISIWGM